VRSSTAKSRTKPTLHRGRHEWRIREAVALEEADLSEFRVLLAADKSQTGFDQSFMHAMEADKRLANSGRTNASAVEGPSPGQGRHLRPQFSSSTGRKSKRGQVGSRARTSWRHPSSTSTAADKVNKHHRPQFCCTPGPRQGHAPQSAPARHQVTSQVDSPFPPPMSTCQGWPTVLVFGRDDALAALARTNNRLVRSNRGVDWARRRIVVVAGLCPPAGHETSRRR
jgi:hypothetical protein